MGGRPDTGVVDVPDSGKPDTTPEDTQPQADVAEDRGPDAAPDADQPDADQPDADTDVADADTDAADGGMDAADGDMDAAMDATPDAEPDAADGGADDAPDGVIVEDVTADAADAADGMTGECTTSADCASAMGGPVCDATTRRCVPCTATEDVCAVGNYCNANRCVAGCRSATDCMSAMSCDTATHTCVGCVANADCALGTICSAGTCVPGCATGRACGAGSTCCGTACFNTQTDPMNCGVCGMACAAGSSCCNGACVNPATDPANCGACGTACSVANATASCAAGACGVAACAAGFGDCDMNPANGCEANVSNSATACGRCGNACPAVANATPSCAAGACGFTCSTGFGDCDGMAANGCETALTTTAASCGRCGNACPAAANAAPSCAAGACGFTCNAGFGNCDGMAANGCEANLNTSTAACGACGRACAPANATGACTDGACGVAACRAGFGNCDMNAANGCETNTTSDRANCGACGMACSPSAVCFAGTCRDLCTAPLAVCGTTCVDLQTNNANCGTCGSACAARANATNTCAAGACALACNRGFGNCDANAANGCETNTSTSTGNCGACGTVCSFPNATSVCRAGVCAIGTCSAGFADCDMNPANGCETNVTAMPNNCGACGRVCSFPNAAATCAASACALGACGTGFANCDRAAANGCEVNTNTSSLNCGACARSCTAGQACFNGTCVTSCPVGTTFCAGGCVNTQTDRLNCGTCGRVCASGEACTTGTCRAAAPANDTIAGAVAINLATSSSDFTATTTGATHNLDTPCLSGTNARGADVFYRFTLARREFVFADTATATYDTVLFFATAAGVPVTTQTAGDQVCNDDNGVCTDAGLTSRAYTVLNPGDYLLVVSGYADRTGTTPVHFEHVASGSGSLSPLAAGASTISGVTTTATAGTLSSGSCGGAGPENAYWWVSCPGLATTSVSLAADTCGTATFDTVLYLNNGNGFTACNDDSCGLQSRLAASYSAVPRMHALYVDGFGPTSAGAYTVRVTRP